MKTDPILDFIPKEEVNRILSQPNCEIDIEFMGFTDIYKSLSEIIPRNKIVIDFGCYLAAQAYYFKDHTMYIGVDVDRQDRFTPANAKHYVCTIQEFIKKHVPEILQKVDQLDCFAICSYVPDVEAKEMVRKTFQNVFCYYPGGKMFEKPKIKLKPTALH